MRRIAILLASLALAVLAGISAPSARAHGEEDEMEIEALAEQPARVLAQQAMAELVVREDTQEAAISLDAALESEDASDVDVALLREATETLDGGDPDGAVALLDRALSTPLGEASGAALHEAGREFEPADRSQEVVAIVAGAALLVLGAWLLAGRRVTSGRT